MENLGPLANLVGTWEGDKGVDIAPSKDRGIKQNLYRERVVFTPMDDVHNHEQHLACVRYQCTIWPLGSADPFHEEMGYWIWDKDRKEVLRCFLVPRGISIIAGGKVEPDATTYVLVANAGDCTHGICMNKFLDKEFKTEKYKVSISSDGETFSYEQTSYLRLKGRPDLFEHTDKNTLKKVKN